MKNTLGDLADGDIHHHSPQAKPASEFGDILNFLTFLNKLGHKPQKFRMLRSHISDLIHRPMLVALLGPL